MLNMYVENDVAKYVACSNFCFFTTDIVYFYSFYYIYLDIAVYSVYMKVDSKCEDIEQHMWHNITKKYCYNNLILPTMNIPYIYKCISKDNLFFHGCKIK